MEHAMMNPRRKSPGRPRAKEFILFLGLIGFLLLSPIRLALAQNLTALSVGPTNPTLAIGEDLRFTATGSFSDGSTRVLSSTASVTVGANHSCAVLFNGTVKCWG